MGRRILGVTLVLLLAGCRDKLDDTDGSLDGNDLNFHLQLVNGSVFYASVLLGDVVLVNFWDTWCGPCRQEQDDLNRLYTDFHDDGVELIGVALAANGLAEVQAYLTSSDVQYTSGLFGPSVEARFGSPESIPRTYIIGRNGRVAQTVIGARDYDDYVAMISPLLEE